MLVVGAEHQPIIERSDELTSELVMPPQDNVDVCPRCRSWNDTGEGHCSNCEDVVRALGTSPMRVRLVSLYEKQSLLRNWLTQYKGRLKEEDEPFVPDYVPVVRSLLGRFLIERGADLAGVFGEVDGLVVVPSTDRPLPHPLTAVLESLALDTPVLDVLRRGPGPLTFRQPHPEGYVINGEASLPARVLLVDDVYTTGAHSNSAAYALRANGVEVAGLMAVARRINPGYMPEVASLWERQKALPFHWTKIPL